MFEEFGSLDDGAVAAAITAATREEAAATARRIAAIAELTTRRCGAPGSDPGTDIREYWACDTWDAATAEISAAYGATRGVTSGQMQIALALRHRLPRVGALLAAGTIGYWLAYTIVERTGLIHDPHAVALVDQALAADITTWGPLSQRKTEEAIDFWIDRHDPGAIRRTRATARGRDVVIGTPDDAAGTTSFWGSLLTPDAAALDRRLIELAHTVCPDDPRTIPQRRADAVGALVAGADTLACRCGSPTCPVAGKSLQRSNILIHVVADAPALHTPADPETSGHFSSGPVTVGSSTADTPAPKTAGAALVVGRGVIPTPLLAELIYNGATVKPLYHPGIRPPEPQYRPSTALDEYVRFRDLTCRFPNCDRPSVYCDVDHSVPYNDGGATHASNLKCLCRHHSRLRKVHSSNACRDLHPHQPRQVRPAPWRSAPARRLSGTR